jgi:hypothetical protein
MIKKCTGKKTEGYGLNIIGVGRQEAKNKLGPG